MVGIFGWKRATSVVPPGHTASRSWGHPPGTDVPAGQPVDSAAVRGSLKYGYLTRGVWDEMFADPAVACGLIAFVRPVVVYRFVSVRTLRATHFRTPRGIRHGMRQITASPC
ncbi:hypothetical protein M8J75_007876 [Diaphorina citri]|nr:hypothetical protein M8J75_007876 [Diaphorina citri]KAI5718227.1 hypothetical protein M8J77_018303 [Diaphorina citri]